MSSETPRQIPLPKGDLWRPYQYDEHGNIIPREDTISSAGLQALQARANLTGDARRLAMDELMATPEAAEIISLTGGKVHAPGAE